MIERVPLGAIACAGVEVDDAGGWLVVSGSPNGALEPEAAGVGEVEVLAEDLLGLEGEGVRAERVL